MVLPRIIRLRLSGHLLPRASVSRRLATTSQRSFSVAAASSSRAISAPRYPTQRRWASAAAMRVEETEQAEEQGWPERILPEMTEKDRKRLKRQRNVGM